LKRIGLALGSGGARGWAHIGVINALRDAGVEIACVAGASMGALVGSALASDCMDLLESSARRLDWRQALYNFLEMSFPRSGLIDGAKIVDFIRGHVEERRIEELRLPYAAVATDVRSGREIVIREGDLIEAIRASISIPGIFTPVLRDRVELVDGGLVNPVPVNVARSLGADFVIAVDVNHGAMGTAPRQPRSERKDGKPPRAQRFLAEIRKKLEALETPLGEQTRYWLERASRPSMFDVLGNSIVIMQSQITETRLRLEPPDLLIQPGGDVGYMEFHRAAEAIGRGYAATMEKLAKSRVPGVRRR